MNMHKVEWLRVVLKIYLLGARKMLWMPPTLKEQILSTEIKQPLIKKGIPSYRGGSSDGYGIKVPKA
jgi:hypothetical protein